MDYPEQLDEETSDIWYDFYADSEAFCRYMHWLLMDGQPDE